MDQAATQHVQLGRIVLTTGAAFHVEDIRSDGIIVVCYRQGHHGLEFNRRIGLEPTIRTMRDLADRAIDTLLKLA